MRCGGDHAPRSAGRGELAPCHPGGVRRSEFWVVAEDVLGAARARSLVADLVLSDLGDRTAQRALEDGVEPGGVWTALCDALDVPAGRRFTALDERRRA